MIHIACGWFAIWHLFLMCANRAWSLEFGDAKNSWVDWEEAAPNPAAIQSKEWIYYRILWVMDEVENPTDMCCLIVLKLGFDRLCCWAVEIFLLLLLLVLFLLNCCGLDSVDNDAGKKLKSEKLDEISIWRCCTVHKVSWEGEAGKQREFREKQRRSSFSIMMTQWNIRSILSGSSVGWYHTASTWYLGVVSELGCSIHFPIDWICAHN